MSKWEEEKKNVGNRHCHSSVQSGRELGIVCERGRQRKKEREYHSMILCVYVCARARAQVSECI